MEGYNHICRNQSRTLIDPDLLSLLNVGLAGLAAICGLYQVFSTLDDKKKEYLHNKADFMGYQRNVREIKRSIYSFVSNVESLEKFLNRVNKRGKDGRDVFSMPAIYGQVSLYLYDFELEIFIKYQEGIFDSLRQYSINLSSVASFLSENNEITANESRIMIKSELDILIDKLNNLQKEEITIMQLINSLKKIAVYIHNIIETLEQIYGNSGRFYFD